MVPLTLAIIAINIVAIVFAAFVRGRAKEISIASAALSLAISLYMVFLFATSGAQSSVTYIPYLNVALSFGLSGISSVLLLMAEIIILVTAVSGNTERAGLLASSALISLFQISAVGLFTSTNLLLFFVFWDIGIVAMFLMINLLGSEMRHNASVNFVLYELFASSMLLLAIILLYAYLPAHSLNIGYITSAAGSLPLYIKTIVLISMFIAFMTNMAIFPMHLWLPDAYTEASTQGSMLLSGVLTKFGGYGMLILFALPIAANYTGYVAALAIVSVVYASFMLIKQKDLKRVIAYSAMLEMGVILVAVAASNSIATEGAVYGMFSQGLSMALAFLAVGVIKSIYDERNIDRLRDIVSGARSTAYMLAIAMLSIIGFPFTSGFVSEILIFFGSTQSFELYGLLPLVGILVMGGYFYHIISRCFLSRSRPTKAGGSPDITERFGFYALSVLIVLVGVLPFLVLGLLKL
ncbi:MAG: NADH-quinone oxidoreductase subunit M [Candidatus Micrarchaeota archaeon]|nr:NADH-quinone oxidoreductase subunit M [Candidatus Micrarchaeota archaeon]